MLTKASKPELATRQRGAATLARGGDVAPPRTPKSLADVTGAQYAESTQGVERGILVQRAANAGIPHTPDMTHEELTKVLGEARMLSPIFGGAP